VALKELLDVKEELTLFFKLASRFHSLRRRRLNWLPLLDEVLNALAESTSAVGGALRHKNR
jgi:hypothetical protein